MSKILFIFLTIFCVSACPASAAKPIAYSGLAGQDIRQSVRHALEYNPQLQQAQEARQQAVHGVRRAQAGFYPTIGIWAGGGIIQSDDVTTRAKKEEHDVVGTGTTGLQLSQSLWQGGGTMASVRSAEAALESRTWLVMDNANSLAYGAISTHADILRRRVLIDLSQKNVHEHQQILRLLQTRFVQGISSQGDVDQVKSRLARADATLLMHRTGLDVALANYMRITGQPVPALLLPVTAPTQGFATQEQVRETSVAHNFRIQAELANIRAILGEQDVARSRFSPRVSLDAGPAYSDWARQGTNYQWTWNTMLNFNWEIFSGGADMANYQSMAARVREARKALHSTMDMLDEEIRIAFSRTRDAAEQAKAFGRAKTYSRSARDNFFTQFEAGKKDLINILDAESEYFNAAVEECVHQTDAVLGQYRMLALSGTLLHNLHIDVSSLTQAPPSLSVEEAPHKAWNFLAPPSTLDTEAATGSSTLRQPLR